MSNIPGIRWDGAPVNHSPITYRGYSSIQKLIDKMKPGQTAIVQPGRYHINTTINMRPNVSLDLTGSEIILDADVNAIACAPGASIRGGIIDCSNVTFTKVGLLLDASKKFALTDRTIIDGIKLIGNWQTGGSDGTAVMFRGWEEANTDVNIYGVKIVNSIFSFFTYGVHATAIRSTGTHNVYLNGNILSNLTIVHCEEGISLEQDVDTHVEGWQINNIQLQWGWGAEKPISIAGTFHSATNIMVWDWPGEQLVDLSANYSIFSANMFTAKINNTGYNNQVTSITP